MIEILKFLMLVLLGLVGLVFVAGCVAVRDMLRRMDDDAEGF